MIIILLLHTVSLVLTAQCPSTPSPPDDTVLSLCALDAFGTSIDKYTELDASLTQRDCVCRKGTMVTDNSGSRTCSYPSSQDCSSCDRRAWVAEVEVYGPYATGCTQSDLMTEINNRWKSGFDRCLNKVCSTTKSCSNADLDMVCDNAGGVYSLIVTKNVSAGGYPLKLKQKFSDMTLSAIAAVKDTLSKIINVVPSEMGVLFQDTTTDVVQVYVAAPIPLNYSNAWSSQTSTAIDELTSRMLANRDLLDTVRAAAPSYCSEFVSLGYTAQTTIDGPVTFPNALPSTCTAKLLDDFSTQISTCAKKSCACLMYPFTAQIPDLQCAIRYPYANDARAAQCYTEQLICLNDTVLPYMRGAAECKDSYNSLITTDRVFKGCMRNQCINEASRFYSESLLRQICTTVSQYAGTLPTFGQQVMVKPTLPPATTMDPSVPIDTVAPTPVPPTPSPTLPPPTTLTPTTLAPTVNPTQAVTSAAPTAVPSISPTPSGTKTNTTNTTSNATNLPTATPSVQNQTNTSTQPPKTNGTVPNGTTTSPNGTTPSPTTVKPTTGSAANSTSSSDDGGGGSNLGLIIGAIVGAVILVGVGIGLFMYLKSKNTVKLTEAEEMSVPLQAAQQQPAISLQQVQPTGPPKAPAPKKPPNPLIDL